MGLHLFKINYIQIMRDLKGFAEWYCWLHKITSSSPDPVKRSALGVFMSLGLKNDLPEFLRYDK